MTTNNMNTNNFNLTNKNVANDNGTFDPIIYKEITIVEPDDIIHLSDEQQNNTINDDTIEIINGDNLIRVKLSNDKYKNISQNVVDEISDTVKNKKFIIIKNDKLEITPKFSWDNNSDFVATGIRTKTFQVIESLEYLDDIINDFVKTIPLYKVIDDGNISIAGIYETTIYDIKMNNYINNEGKCITTVILLYSKNKYSISNN